MDAADILPVISGVATACAVYLLASLLAVRLRGFWFARARIAQPPDPSYMPDIRAPEAMLRSPVHESLRSLMLVEHERANRLQNTCIASLVGASATLFVAFMVAAAGVTVAEPATALAEHETTGTAAGVLHLYSAALDLAALGIVGWAFLRSGRFRADWIRHRAVAEFLRQWSLCDVVFLASPQSVTPRYEAYLGRVEAALAPGHEADVLDAVVAFGDLRLQELRNGIASVKEIPAEALRFYLARRPVRQVRWFSGSAARISGQHGHREIVMLALFGGAILAALVKTAVLLFGHTGGVAAPAHAIVSWATFGLLVFIGLAAASTSAYMGQNLRSLRHRYRAQLRSIEDWFSAHAAAVALSQSDRTIVGSDIAMVAEAVTRFEDLMIAELVDWISITTDDAMELAPS